MDIKKSRWYARDIDSLKNGTYIRVDKTPTKDNPTKRQYIRYILGDYVGEVARQVVDDSPADTLQSFGYDEAKQSGVFRN